MGSLRPASYAFARVLTGADTMFRIMAALTGVLASSAAAVAAEAANSRIVEVARHRERSTPLS